MVKRLIAPERCIFNFVQVEKLFLKVKCSINKHFELKGQKEQNVRKIN